MRSYMEARKLYQLDDGKIIIPYRLKTRISFRWRVCKASTGLSACQECTKKMTVLLMRSFVTG